MTALPTVYISHGYCPACGYDLTGVPCDDDEQVTCPECGTPNDHRLIPVAPPPGPLKKLVSFPKETVGKSTWVLGLVVAAVVLMGMLLPSIGMANGCARSVKCATQMKIIHRSMRYFATDDAGSYPTHAALLIPVNYVTPKILLSPLDSGIATVWCVGDVDLDEFDWSLEAIEALDAAVESSNLSAPYYRLGDFWFARLPEPTNSPNLVAMWTDVLPDGTRQVVFDSNPLEVIDAANWSAVWKQDAVERRKLGLPAVSMPSAGRGRR